MVLISENRITLYTITIIIKFKIINEFKNIIFIKKTGGCHTTFYQNLICHVIFSHLTKLLGVILHLNTLIYIFFK